MIWISNRNMEYREVRANNKIYCFNNRTYFNLNNKVKWNQRMNSNSKNKQ